MAEAYLKFLYSDTAQDIIGKHGYRPSKSKYQEKYARPLPGDQLFTLAQVADNWDRAKTRFFADGAIFDQIYQSLPAKKER